MCFNYSLENLLVARQQSLKGQLFTKKKNKKQQSSKPGLKRNLANILQKMGYRWTWLVGKGCSGCAFQLGKSSTLCRACLAAVPCEKFAELAAVLAYIRNQACSPGRPGCNGIAQGIGKDVPRSQRTPSWEIPI